MTGSEQKAPFPWFKHQFCVLSLVRALSAEANRCWCYQHPPARPAPPPSPRTAARPHAYLVSAALDAAAQALSCSRPARVLLLDLAPLYPRRVTAARLRGCTHRGIAGPRLPGARGNGPADGEHLICSGSLGGSHLQEDPLSPGQLFSAVPPLGRLPKAHLSLPPFPRL